MNFWRFKSSFGRNGQVTLAAFEVPFGQRVSKVRRLTCAAMLRALLKGPFKRGGIVVHSHCRSYGNSSHLENREFVCKSPSLCGIFILKLAPYYSLTSWARPRDKKKSLVSHAYSVLDWCAVTMREGVLDTHRASYRGEIEACLMQYGHWSTRGGGCMSDGMSVVCAGNTKCIHLTKVLGAAWQQPVARLALRELASCLHQCHFQLRQPDHQPGQLAH